MKLPVTLSLDPDSGTIQFIDQTRLPGNLEIVECTTVKRLAAAIRNLEIRGAPALGVAGGFGIALAAFRIRKTDRAGFLDALKKDGDLLIGTRPTAINLSWGVRKVLQAVEQEDSIPSMRDAAVQEALAIAREDEACCRAIGDHGAALLPNHGTVLTHCNAGALACSTYGTALGVIRSAVAQGKDIRVIACETRPLLQGARLTAWELVQDGIDTTVITDSMAAGMMQSGRIDCAVVGADRITHDAVFNKIGTYMHAVCAKHHGVPFYVAAPLSTFDAERSADDIVIEERAREEVATCGSRMTVPEGAKVYNPSFDATPMELITAVITERGLVTPPVDMKAFISRHTIR
ncbi:MAG: putative methylthioribose-1-phosphate isomerase [Methanoregula sp. PtaU1.Bin051]|nr:MAG: putative methylthioribose-1-phosphate isomerase [Methanoregula sp. PtaU1.Bin051]